MDDKLNPEEPKAETEFDWREVDPDALLQNPTYLELHKRHEERGKNLDVAYSLPTVEERLSAIKAIHKEEEQDEAANLLTEIEKREYLYYFTKFKYLEDLREKVDPGMYSILHKFNRLPLCSLNSCSGHIYQGTDQVQEEWFPALTFVAYKGSSPKEREIQEQFIDNIDSLNYDICVQLGVEPYNILYLQGTKIGSEGYEVEADVKEALKNGGEINMYINLTEELSLGRGREALSTIWQGFFNYLEGFVDSPEELPDLKQGNIFVRNMM